jgi:hypothetical protein
MIRKSGSRFSEKIMLHKKTAKKNGADRVGAKYLSAS